VPRIRLIATDIDGMLLGSDGMVLPANQRVLKQAQQRGVQLALVTARKRSTTFAIADMLGVACACIAHNGARIWDWQGREVRHITLDLSLAHEVARFADQHAVPLVITIDEINYYSPAYPLDPAWRGPDDRMVPSSEAVLRAPPTRIIAAGERGVDQIFAAFGAATDSVTLRRYCSRAGHLESAVLTHPRATKEEALAELAQQAGIQPEEVLALGDAEADAEMLRWAGIGVAMGNAMPEARAAAQWIAPDHDEAGVAVAVERFVLSPLGVAQSPIEALE
jgi:hydroxymethylpyrimidine pyrophosphatase-like HAD family hydrolase